MTYEGIKLTSLMRINGKLISNSVQYVDLLVIIGHLKVQFCSLMHVLLEGCTVYDLHKIGEATRAVGFLLFRVLRLIIDLLYRSVF